MIGHLLSDGEVVVHTLNGLTFDYKEISAVIRARDTVTTFEELHDKFIDHESYLKHEEAKSGVSPIIAKSLKRGITKRIVIHSRVHHKYSYQYGQSR